MRIIILTIITVFCVLELSAQFRTRKRTPEKEQSTAAASSFAEPKEYTIGGIEVSGLKVLDKNAMVSLTGLRVGDKIRIPGDATGNAIRKLWKHGLVGDVSILVDRVEADKVFLNIHLTERPRLSDYYFTGISKGRQSTLKDEIGLVRGKIVNDAMIRNVELATVKHFIGKGFLNTSARAVQIPDTLNRGNVKLRIDVDLKAKVRIDRIKIDGNQLVADARLKKKLKKTKEYARLTLHRAIIGELLNFRPGRLKHWADSGYAVRHKNRTAFVTDNVKLNIFSGSKLSRSQFEEDKNTMVDFYNSVGFRDALVISDSVMSKTPASIDLGINVNEGRKYYFRDISWTGNYVRSEALLNSILNIKRGDVYNRELLEKRLTFDNKSGDVSSLYMDDGYLFFRAVPVEVAVEGDSIDIEIRLHEGDQATINEVNFTGNERTSDHVIRRELTTVPGRKFSRSDIIRTQQLLGQSQYFNPQTIEPDIRPNPTDGTVDITWKLEEQSNDQVQLSGGWGGFYGFVGTLGFTFNNFSARNITNFKKWRPLPIGDGQRLSIQAQANGKSFQSYSLSFTEPWLGGAKPNALTVSLNHSVSRRPTQNFTFVSSNYFLKSIGLTVGMSRRLRWPDNYFTLSNSLSYRIYDYKNYFGNTAALPTVGKTNQLKFETILSRNSIDSPFFPTNGSSMSLSLSLSPPYSLWRKEDYLQDNAERYKWIELYKWMFDSKFYVTIVGSKKPQGRSLVLEGKMHFGYIGSYTSKVGPGPFERFMVGGAGLAGGFNSFVLGQEIIGLRGYPDNQVTPPYYGLNSQAGNQITGGLVYEKVGLELRYPLTVGQAATIYGMIYVEAGNNWNDYNKINPLDMYRSAGFGARLFMPAFGLIGLNWAYGFDTLPFANTKSGSQFHFTIGQQIR